MEQEMYFITEVDVDNKSFSNIVNDRHEINRKRKKKKPTLKVTNVEKRILAKLVEQEPVLWDKNDELHCNNNALLAAWSRISNEMPGRTVSECKIIWRSLKDAVRYRKNKISRIADSGEPEPDEYELDYNWEFSDVMSFLMQSSSGLKRPRRSNPMADEKTESSELRISSVMNANTISSTVVGNTNDCDDTSDSESTFGYTAQNKEKDPLAESVLSISNNIRDFVKATAEERQEKSSLKFDYIWHNLDKLFRKLPSDAVDELNVKFMQMTYEKIPKRSS